MSEPLFLSTCTSLLSRVRDSKDRTAWCEFEGRYRELLMRFCRKRGLQHADAEDVVQAVFVNLAKSMPGFVYDPKRGRFRDYLYRCVRSAIWAWSRRTNGRGVALDMNEAADVPDCADDGSPGGDAALWQEEWVGHHYRVALEAVRQTFDERSVAMFEQHLAGMSVADLASVHGMTPEAVYAARRRIRVRMQELIARQIEEEDRVDEPASPTPG